MPNHYETLQVDSNASPGEIKKQFYNLSKSYHPDLHPNDSAASHRFVQISEAYATLGSPEKKARYDRDYFRSQQAPSSSHSTPTGSFSSASTPAGGRPASGLSRRRTHFHGPPPSFYRSGGWGQHSEKRSEQASKASHTHEAQGRAQSGPVEPGMGPGGSATGFDNDVPHFDHRGHYQTHSTIERMRHRAKRKREVRVDIDDELRYGGGRSVLLNFVVLSGVLAAIYGVSGVLMGSSGRGQRQREERT